MRDYFIRFLIFANLTVKLLNVLVYSFNFACCIFFVAHIFCIFVYFEVPYSHFILYILLPLQYPILDIIIIIATTYNMCKQLVCTSTDKYLLRNA